MSDPGASPVAAVLLAAGRSQRMGAQKLLLPWYGGTLLAAHLAAWRDRARVFVVWNDPAVEAELDRLGHARPHRARNPDPGTGMLGSLRVAARAGACGPDTRAVVVAPGDHPPPLPETARALVAAALAGAPWVQPAHGGVRGHPIVLRRDVWDAVVSAAGPQTLRDALIPWAGGRRVLPVDDPAVISNMNTRADAARARERRRRS